jgi:hypothetical protein
MWSKDGEQLKDQTPRRLGGQRQLSAFPYFYANVLRPYIRVGLGVLAYEPVQNRIAREHRI